MPERRSIPAIPDEAAIAAIRARGLNFRPSGHWSELWKEAHQIAFTVARSAGFDILGDIHAALLRSMEQGESFESFRASLTPLLRKKGWWGGGLGSPWRLRTIFRQNLRVSAARGDWERFQALKKKRPWLRYTAIEDERARPLHKSWHGLILPVDDPWWRTHFPPNGWNCRCKVLSVDEADLAFHGWRVAAKAPNDGLREWRDPRSGRSVSVPLGIDPGWDHNPGDTDTAARSAKLAMDRLAFLPPAIGAAAISSLALAFPQVIRELAAWIRGIAEKSLKGEAPPTGDRRVVGALADPVLKFARSRALELETAAISVSDRDLGHALRQYKFEPLPLEVWNSLPELLREPEAIYWDGHTKALVYLVKTPDCLGKLIVQVNYSTRMNAGGGKKKARLVINNLRTGSRVYSLGEFADRTRFQRIK